MEELNRVSSPMHLLDEDLSESYEVIRQKKQDLRDRQRIKSPFQVGTVEDINRRICRLDRRLKQCTYLLCESPSESRQPTFVSIGQKSKEAGEKKMRRVQEVAEVSKFAGIYSVKATFGFNTSERVKKIAKISTKAKKAEILPAPKKEVNTGIPKFVELYQFPGYDRSELTPLPEGISPVQALNKAMNAFPIKLATPYKTLFTKWLFSKISQAILMDMFWFYFIDHYGSAQDKFEMPNFFSRTADNYTKFILFCDDRLFRDRFITAYPSVMSQALFAAYCDCFPDSYSNFGNDFKETLVQMTYRWLTGIAPSDRLWQHWNAKELEPEMVKSKEAKKQGSVPATNSESRTGMSHLGTAFPEEKHQEKAGDIIITRVSPSVDSTVAKSSRSSQSIAPGHMETVIEVVKRKNRPGGKGVTIRQGSAVFQAGRSSSEQTSSASKNEGEPPPPNLFENEKVAKESHPIGPGPTLVRKVFNLSGHSPLVLRHMRSRNTGEELRGLDILVHRTELRNPPPLDAETYQDVIRRSSKNLRQLSENFKTVQEKFDHQSNRLLREQRVEMRLLRNKQEALLSNAREVHRLSDFIVLESKRETGSASFGADAIVAETLNSIIVN